MTTASISGWDMAKRMDHKVTAAFCFPGLVSIAAQDHRPELAAQLLGTAEALRDQVATIGSASDLGDYDQLLAEARPGIDIQTYAAQVAEGRALPQAEAVAFALRSFAD